jgi:4-amino-4-deoxy-L-arabinose transferase-like glycosyltransferase
MKTAALADVDAAPLSSSGERPRLRTAVYCLVLALFAAILAFWELGADSLTGDEAQYALVVQNIKQSGNWIYLTPYPPTPYLQKPPLYFWLTALSYDLLGRDEFAYRAWSAATGVGAVVLTCILGGLLFTPEIGGWAGLLLLMNRSFLLVHGARSGTFDALLTFLVLAGVVAYWLGARRGLRWRTWIAIGALAGLASLTKPFAGVPMVAFLALHAILADRSSPRRIRLAGPALALVVLAAVAGPWYLAQAVKYDSFASEMFGRNLIERVVHGVDDKHVEDWKFYIEQISKSSLPFLLSCAAAVYGIVAWATRFQTRQHALLVLLGTGWVLLFSLSASKAVHYVYPAFPFITVTIVSGLALLARIIARRYPNRPAITGGFVAMILAGFAFQYARTMYYAIPADRSPYVPWEMYKALAPAIGAREVRVIFYGFPDHQIDWRTQMQLGARDCYYLKQMLVGAAAIRDPAELGDVLRAESPTLLILSRQADVHALRENLGLAQRTDARFAYSHQGYLVFGVDLRRVLELVARPGQQGVHVRVMDDSTAGLFRLSLAPTVVAPGRITASVRLAEGSSSALVRYVFVLQLPDGGQKKLDDRTARPQRGLLEVSATVEQQMWRGTGPHEVTLTLHSADPPNAEPVRSTLEDVRLTLLPYIPPEPHPRR